MVDSGDVAKTVGVAAASGVVVAMLRGELTPAELRDRVTQLTTPDTRTRRGEAP
jgi:hypothetical protein